MQQSGREVGHRLVAARSNCNRTGINSRRIATESKTNRSCKHRMSQQRTSTPNDHRIFSTAVKPTDDRPLSYLSESGHRRGCPALPSPALIWNITIYRCLKNVMGKNSWRKTSDLSTESKPVMSGRVVCALHPRYVYYQLR